MKVNEELYNTYVKILNEELIAATGCTEPIAIAYAASIAKDTLGAIPDKVIIEISGNIIKNVKSVVVPNTGGLHGIKAAVAIGLIGGVADKKLEVISSVTKDQIELTKSYLEKDLITIKHLKTPHIFDIMITIYKDEHSAFVRITDYHTNVVSIKYDDKVIADNCIRSEDKSCGLDYSSLTIERIVEFGDILNINDVKELLDKQINYNMSIAEEGLKHDYGANIGKILLRSNNDLVTKAKAYAASGSDARMNGCEMPVIINSGSGNQGLTTSIPIIIYAREHHIDDDRLYRALAIANLITIHLKSGIGRLSAYCGAVSAGCSSAAGISYLLGGDLKAVTHTLINGLAINSGIICDGAKSSCAAKISSSVDGGLLGLRMYQEGNNFYDGDGIVHKDVEAMIKNVSKIAHDGMVETDNEIINIMVNK
jgi:L-cysteine desulfidase